MHIKTDFSRIQKTIDITIIGFFNKPGKATRGFVNKVVREVDRVVVPGYQFRREYVPRAPAKTPPSEVKVVHETKVEVDYEFPQYMKRNDIGLMISLPQHYPEHKLKFLINFDNGSVRKFKTEYNMRFQDTKVLKLNEYIISTMSEVKTNGSLFI